MRALCIMVLVAVVSVTGSPLMRIQKTDGSTIEVAVASIEGISFATSTDASSPRHLSSPIMAAVGFDQSARAFSITVAQAGEVELSVYSLSGQCLYRYHRPAARVGTFKVPVNGAFSANGTYLVKATIASASIDRRVTVCR